MTFEISKNRQDNSVARTADSFINFKRENIDFSVILDKPELLKPYMNKKEMERLQTNIDLGMSLTKKEFAVLRKVYDDIFCTNYKDYESSIVPLASKEILLCMVYGPSRSGKSKWVNWWINNNTTTEPVYIITPHFNDKAYEKNRNRFNFILPLQMEEEDAIDFEPNSVVVFDDCEKIRSKKLQSFIDTCMQRGSHMGLKAVFVIIHKEKGGVFTKNIRSDSNSVVFFPSITNTTKIQEVLTAHHGYTNQEAYRLTNDIKSPWALIDKNLNIMISLHEIRSL